MKTTLTRLFTVMMLIIVSMGAMADVKVLYGEKGTELQPDKYGTITLAQKELTGGTIIISQEDQKDGTTNVTFAVTPDKNYKLAENGLEVYAVIPPGISSTRGIEVSTTLTLKSEDFKDEASKRTYTTTIDSKLNLWVKKAEFQNKRDGAKDTPDFSGIWYIANETNHASTTISSHWYLVPGANPQTPHYADAYFNNQYCNTSGSGDYTGDNYGDPEKPFLTTYQTDRDLNSIWIVVSTGDGYYNIIHAKTGKYIVYEPPYKDATHRKSMHLESTTTPGDNAKFTISGSSLSGSININPKNVTSGNMYFNPAAGVGNRPQYYGTGQYYHEGMIGLYSVSTDKSQWYLEDASSATALVPEISDVDGSTNTFTITSPAAAFSTIRYTTDGTTTPDASTGTTATSDSPINITGTWNVQAVGVFKTFVTPLAGPKELSPAKCITPVISYDYTSTMVSITCATPGSTIYYTIGDGDPTTEFSSLSVTSPTTVKAIAKLDGFPDSDVATLTIGQVATPTILDNGSNAISITCETEGASIYYTLEDSGTPATEYDPSSPLGAEYSNKTIRAIAVKENMITSTVGSGSVKLQCATPVITRDGMTFTLSCSMPTDATLYYTLKGGSEVEYRGTPVPFTTDDLTMTVTAVARHSDYTQSETATMELLNGTGTPADPYLIYGTTDFTTFVTNVNNGTTASACYKLCSDVSASGMAAITTEFTGTFDGGMFTISDLSHALFNTVNGGVVKNVILKDVTISENDNGNAGAICNEATGDTRIYNCGVISGSSSGSENVGGLVGLLDGSSRVINCFSGASIGSGKYRGGIVGKNTVASTSGNLQTMVMNCMFYGNISTESGYTQIAPIYGGEIIHNKYSSDTNTGLNNYCYFMYDEEKNPYVTSITTYNGALGAEERFLNRFEFFRLTLNSTRSMAAFYACGNASEKEQMAKWVLDKSIAPYPILKSPGYYPSIVNPDAKNAVQINPTDEEDRNKGRKLGTLTVTINSVGRGAQFQAPEGAHLIDEDGNTVSSRSLTLNITDKDYANYNFNYKKIQLPYYSEVGTGNYTGNRVVTGWKITSFTDGTPGTFTNTGADVTFDSDGNIDTTPYNFVDRKCTNKDLYGTGGSNRVFNQGAYWEVPDDVTGIVIEPYWANAVYLSDAYYDVTYNGTNKYSVTVGGSFSSPLEGNQTVYDKLGDAIDNLSRVEGETVYDYAVVLVGNYHHYTDNAPAKDKKPFTIMSADLDGDLEPDNTLFYYHNSRKNVSPIRFDFLNMPGIGMVKRTHDATNDPEPGIFKPNGWFEITNTVFVRFGQFEYAEAAAGSGYTAKLIEAPVILQGGIYEQFVTSRQHKSGLTNYLLVGGNAWFKNFANGCHTNVFSQTPKIPINVTGGDFENFYLTGIYQPNGNPDDEDAECYIDGGRFEEVAGAGMQRVDGNVTWLINGADITNFFGGGINHAQSITGNITTKISNSYVDEFYGGPKFGTMTEGKNVKTTATDCHFGKFFGAGYGGTSLNRVGCEDATIAANKLPTWNTYINHYTRSYEEKHHSNSGSGSDVTVNAISTSYDYEYIIHSDGNQTVARFFVNFASLSLASTRDVYSDLTGCTIGDFYGGGRLGEVNGNATSTLTNCTVTGNAFGAGYSADVPTVEVWPSGVGLDPLPTYNRKANVFNNANVKLPNEQPGQVNNIHLYKWTNGHNLSTSNPFYENVNNDGYYIFTSESLDNLGAVTGTATLTINGTTTVAKSVYGGGEQSAVNTNTVVIVNNGTIGTAKEDLPSDVTTFGATYGNVYGGGKGKAKNEEGENFDELTIVKMGLVKGNTNVTINGGSILHNVYGGGAYGSVGTFTYDATTGFPTNWTTTDNKGKCTVLIRGGTIGSTGKDNGMVFGSSRGLEGNPETNVNVDKMAWVYDTDVTIGTQGSETGPFIKGSVYGGGENGHNFHDASVTVHSGTIGIAEGSAIVNDGGTPDDDSDDISYSGARFPNRGNVYGSGCGTDTYTGTDSKTYFDFNAGIVRGNTTVLIDGGHVVHNVYGGGAMGSVGTYTFADEAYHTEHPEVPVGKPISCADETGTCTVTVSGGQIGVTGAKMAGYGKGGPDDYGHVFGAGRGEMHDPDQYPNMETCAFFNKTILNISGTAFLTGSVYGGSESGHVLGDTEVNISGGQIGCGKDSSGPFDNAVWADDYIPTGDNMDCTSWPFTAPFAPYDPFANETGDLDQYPNGHSTDGGRLEASDGHTYYGNVFGGGSGSVPYFDTTEGISKYLSTAGSVEGKTTINITGGHIITNVYGGCEATNVKGSATITMTGGTVGVPRTVAQIVAHPLTGYIFGAGKGDQRIFFNKETNVDRTFVNIEGGRVYGSIFGGGEDGHVFQNTTVNIGKTDGTGPTIGTTGTSYVDGNVFGGGRGFGGEALTAGNIGGSVELNIKGGKILGSVYGGGRLASVGYGLYLVDEEIEEDGKTIKPYGILRPDDKYDGSYPNPSTLEASEYYDKGRGFITINISGGTIGNDNEYIYNPTDEQKAAIPNTTFDYQNHLQYTKGGNVFTGGMGRLYALDNTTLLPIWSKLGKCRGTTLNMTGGTVKSSVYGGGEIGAVAEDATVNINGGTVGTKVVDSEDATKYYYFGSVFGGGKGSTDAITYPGGTAEADQIPISEAGTIGGDVQVNLNNGVAKNKPGGIVRQVFGCNDMNGSPKGDVTVHIYATQTSEKADISTKPAKKTNTYDVQAVYGGGNLAAYKPDGGKNTTKVAKVIIDGCELTSIETVYGGGNAASTPATEVTVNGTYEIYEMFGGGNGKDKLPNGTANPGANVGFYDYSAVESTYPTKEDRAKTAFIDKYTYGAGKATVNIFGGTIHRVFGGSNMKGNVRQTALTLLDEGTECQFCVDEAYGGGKSAEMDAEAQLLLACIPGLDAVYGGAEAADVHGNVTLNITNGTFDRVFGGNNISGTIGGSITVNVEEIGCKPVKIGELYGGGNQAGYSVYGYDSDGKPKETGTRLYSDPQVNVMSFTSIGNIFGGGYGDGATMVGNPTVNVNVTYGKYYDNDLSNVGENAKTPNNYPIPSHAKGKIGAINQVFGGGNAAKVIGNTTVNIGTLEKVYVVKQVTANTTLPDGCYIRNNDGTYNAASGQAQDGTTYYEEMDVIGADIRGNVYGGGNNAEVTGNTNVTIGKKEE